MQTLRSSLYLGANRYVGWPAMHLELALGDWGGWRSTDAGDTALSSLLELVPELAEIGADGVDGQDFAAALTADRGVGLWELAARIPVILQAASGCDVSRCSAWVDSDRAHVLFEQHDAIIGISAWRLSRLLLTRLLGEDVEQVDLAATRSAFHAMVLRERLDQTTDGMRRAAQARGIPSFRLSGVSRLLQLGQGHRRQLVFESITADTTSVANKLSQDKAAVSALLRQAGIRVARHELVTTEKAALRVAKAIAGPLVIKPNHGMKGRAVTVGVTGAVGVRAAFTRAHNADPFSQVLIEERIPGDDHRLLIVGGRMIAAARRIPARVRGDGQRSVRELVEIENRDPRRGVGFESLLQKINFDARVVQVLKSQGLGPDDRPEEGRWVYLALTANLSTGGKAVDVSDSVHPAVREAAEAATRMVGLDVCGVDIISTDISRALEETGGVICELNACPGLRPHAAAEGSKLDTTQLCAPIVDLMFDADDDGRIPTVAVTGTGGKTTTSHMTAAMFTAAGMTTGLASTEGVFIDGRSLRQGDMAGAVPARGLLMNPDVEAVVLETSRGALQRMGLGFDLCDVAVVTNVHTDHVGTAGIQTAEEMAELKSTLVRNARNWAVLNADNDLSYNMREQARTPVCLVSADVDNPRIVAHLDDGGRAVVIQASGDTRHLVLCDDGEREELLALADIPATMDGAAEHNGVNAMVATAAAWCAGVEREAMIAALKTFSCSFEQIPGRANLYHGHRFTVMVDYAHNHESMMALRAMVQKLAPSRTRTCVFGTAGNRPDSHFDDITAVISDAFDRYLVFTSDDRRGRPEGEVMRLLEEGLIKAGIPADRIERIEDRRVATAKAFETAVDGEFICIISDDARATWQQILDWKD